MSAILKRAIRTIEIEIEGLEQLKQKLGTAFEAAVETMLKCRGKVVVIGMGKSGLVGQKIAATLTSTGTPAIFLHAAESFHGDLGIITNQDVALLISFSGETAEVVQLMGHLAALGVPLIGITGKDNSTLAHNSSLFLDISVPQEACPLGLAPTTSTTVTMALGDALAMCLLELKNFKEENFALFHPGGSLGKKLTVTVRDLMVKGDRLPIVPQGTLMREAVKVLSQKTLGIVAVATEDMRLHGVFTVGDLMRLVESGQRFLDDPIDQYMIANPKVIDPQTLAAKALYLMETHSITCLVVTDHAKKIEGLIQIYDILRSGIY